MIRLAEENVSGRVMMNSSFVRLIAEGLMSMRGTGEAHAQKLMFPIQFSEEKLISFLA
jgi:hypothetical protein